MANGDDGPGSWGVSHLASMPITLTFGTLLLGVLILLLILRLVFADITVRGGAR